MENFRTERIARCAHTPNAAARTDAIIPYSSSIHPVNAATGRDAVQEAANRSRYSFTEACRLLQTTTRTAPKNRIAASIVCHCGGVSMTAPSAIPPTTAYASTSDSAQASSSPSANGICAPCIRTRDSSSARRNPPMTVTVSLVSIHERLILRGCLFSMPVLYMFIRVYVRRTAANGIRFFPSRSASIRSLPVRIAQTRRRLTESSCRCMTDMV